MARQYSIKAGDFVSFSAGQKAGHALINDSATPFRFLMIGERRADDVFVNPDSNKVFHRLTDTVY